MVHQTLPSVIVAADAEELAASTAAQLIGRLVEVQSQRGSASLVLTGGRMGIAVLEHVRLAAARDSVNWSAIDFFWGDDRFVDAGHPDRNEGQARHALLDHVGIDPSRVHPMKAADGSLGSDVEMGAQAYRQVLAAHEVEGEPLFDVCLLGVGEDGHVASLFPGLDAIAETTLLALSVEGSPKPPPTRITLTLPALCRSREVWLFATGAAKADAVACALSGGASPADLPSAGARGLERTVWFLDSAALGTTQP